MRPIPCILLTALVLALGSGCSPESKIERHIANARKYYAEGRFDAAEIEFASAQRIDPRNPAAMAGLAAIFLDQGSVTMAAPRLAAAKELAPEDLDNRVRLARVFLALGGTTQARAEAVFVLERRADDAEALQILAESSKTPEEISDARARLSTDNAATHVALAMLDIRERNLPAAQTQVQRALEIDPDYAPAHSVLGSLQLASRNTEAATQSLERAARLSPVRSPRRLTYARFLLSTGDTAAGRKALDDIRQEAPDFLPASIALAEVMASTGSRDEALKILESVLGRDPANPDAALLQAGIHLANGQNTVAIEKLEALVTQYPGVAQMHYMLATAYVAINDVNRANASLARALQITPDLADAIVLRSALQVRAGDPASAIQALRELVAKHPELGRARLLLADALRARGQSDEALAIYRTAIESAPKDAQLRFLAGGLFLQLGRTAEARQSFEEALTLRQDFTPAVEQLVALDLAANDLPSAVQRAEKHAALHPGSAEAHVLLAKVAVAQRNTERAEAELRKAIEVNPDAAVAYMLLAQLYIKSSRQEEALTNLQAATAKNPRDISAFMLLGILYQQNEDFKAAQAAYERLLGTNPNFVPALNNLAYLYSENLGQLDKAYELSNRARELRPHDPVAMDTFGWILFQRRDYAWAMSVLNDSAAKLPDNAEVQYHAGMARYIMGDEAGARTALEIAVNAAEDFRGKDTARTSLAILGIDPAAADDTTLTTLRERAAAAPDDPIVRYRLAAVLARRGQLTEAQATYESALKAHPKSAVALINLARFLATQPNGRARAFELAKEANKVAPENIAVMHAVGRIAFDSGDHAWAESLLGTAARRAPDTAAIQWDYADAAYAVGLIDASTAAMETALRLDPDSPRAQAARVTLTLVAASGDRTVSGEVARLASTALAQAPGSVPARMVLAAVDEQRGDTAAAVSAYEEVLSNFPRFSPALKRRAMLAARENPPGQQALEIAARAREALPKDPEVAGALGTIHFRRGEYSRAATLLGEAARGNSASPEIQYLLGIAQMKIGEKERGRASLQRALDLGLSGEAATEARAALAAP